MKTESNVHFRLAAEYKRQKEHGENGRQKGTARVDILSPSGRV
jgi:hypothetical protein